ncbi:MAG: hypothetical protein WB766_03900, partial [Roseiarcus sp.]
SGDGQLINFRTADHSPGQSAVSARAHSRIGSARSSRPRALTTDPLTSRVDKPARGNPGGCGAPIMRSQNESRVVLALFAFAGYRRRMPEPDDDLTPARAEDLRASIAFALTSDGRLAKTQSAELMASIVAERLIARLERDGFVIMRRPPAPGAGAIARGPRQP